MMKRYKNIRFIAVVVLLLVVPSLVMAISWTAMPGLGSGQYNSVAVEDFNKDGYKDIAGVKGDTASVWQQSLSWICPASLYSWSFKGTDTGPTFSATYNAVVAGDMGSGPGNNPTLKPDGMPDTVAATTGGIYIFYGNSLDTWNSTPPVKGVAPANTGYGRMSGVGTNFNTLTEGWTVQCTSPRTVTTNLPESTANGGNLNSATLPYPNLLNQGDTYRFTFSNLSTASGLNPKKAFIVTKGELEVGTGRVDQSFTTTDSKISVSSGNWSNTNLILPDETIDLTINSVTPAAFSVTGSTSGLLAPATADVAYSDGGTGLSFTVSEDKNAGFIAGDKFTFSTYAISGNLITGSATDVVSLRLADVDNDGELEIVAGTQSGIEVYDYNGVLWSTMNTNLPTTGEWRALAVKDMNRDGNMDIVAASTTAGFIKAWHGDGAGNWTVADDLTTSSAIYYSLDVEDVSRDGIYDIIAGVGDSGIEVWLGDSNGNFSQGRKPTGTDRYYDVKISDINYDYKPDIIGAQWGGGIPVWLGDGTGEWWLSETEPIETGDYRAIAVTDMNNDGLPDVAGASYGGGVDVFLQSRVVDPSINWAKSSFPTASGDFQGTAVGDFNRDGNQDIVVAGNASGVKVFYGNGKTKVQSSAYVDKGYTGIGNGTISNMKTDDIKTTTEDWEVTCVTGGANPVFEVSRNGVPEAALYSLPGTYTHSGTGVSFVIYPGTANFAVNDVFTFRTIEGGITNSGIYYGVVTADFNNDGILDVAAASNGDGGIDIWYGNGEGEWDSVPPADGSWDGNAESENIGSGNYYYLAAGDINNDGKLDIVAGSDATGVHVFLNGWDGSTTGWTHNASPPQDPVSTGSYSGVALTDFDNDGNLDIAAASRGGDGVMVWLGNGDGSFNATNTGPDFASSVILTDEYGMGRTMTYYYDGIAAADFDRDGNMDIVAGNLGNFGVQVFYGDGDKLRHGHVTWNLSNVTPPVPSCSNSGNIYVQDLAASSYGQTYYGEYGSFGKDIYISGTKVRAGVTTSDYVTGDSDVTLTAHQPTEDEPWDFTDSCSGGGISIDFPSSGCSNGLILRGTSYSYDPPDLLYFSTYNPGVTTSGQYYGVATEDFNKDGYPDVVAANKNNGGIQVWLNGGSKSFYRIPESSESISSVWTSSTDPVVNGNYKGVAVVDFNKDGNMDIVGAHDFTGGTGAEVWLNSVDLVPPTVVPESLSPESDATDVSTGASISAQFSEDIDILTLRNNDTTGTFTPSSDSTIMVYGSKSGYHSGVINYDSETATVTFYPDAPFTTTEIVTVTFSSKIADPAGNNLDGNGDGTGSDTPSDYFLWSFTVVDTVKPLPPTAVTGTPGEGKAILSWTAPVKNEDNSTLTDLAGFNVYRGNVSGGPYFKINSTAVSSSVTTYTNSPLTNGATYYYVITAVDQYGNESVNSTPVVSVTPALDTVKPSAPAPFTATEGNLKVTLTWAAPTTNEDSSTLTDLAGYWLYRETGPCPVVYGPGPINSVLIPVGTVEYVDTTVANGATYCYAVTAVDSSIGANESAKSVSAEATPVLDVTAPNAPSSVTATGGAAEITLSWVVPAAASDFNSYKIYRHTAPFTNVTDPGVTLVATISNYNTTSWRDTTSNGLVIDTTYYYRITSTDTNGNESATPSNQVSAVPLNPVAALGLSSSNYTIPADGVGQATITAIAQSPLGYPVADGTTINFSVSCTASECGTLSASSAPTTGGTASVTITSSTILTNSVTITASSGTVSGSTTIAFKPGPPSSVTVSSTPSTMVANGADTTTIKAVVKDSGGNLVKDGLYVTFTTTRGTFPNGTTTSDPVATSNGEASVVLTAGTTTGTATITATVGGVTASYTGLTLTADTTAPTVWSVSPTNGNTNVYVGTNISSVFSENIKTSTLTPATFTVSGSVSGAATGVITYDSSAKAVTFDPVTYFSNGETVTVTLTTGITDLAGNATASNYVWSFTAIKPVSQRTPAVVTVSADPVDVPVSVTADDRFSSVTITATVVDQINNPVADGYSVVFSTTKGSFSQTDSSVQTMAVSASGGLASVTLYSTNVYTRTYGVTVTAVCEGKTGSTAVNFRPGPPEDVEWVAYPSAIAADGISATSIWIKVRDAIGGGTSTGLTATVLTDSSRSWTVDAFKGMKLNPDTTQSTKTYTITGNTATTITVTGNMTGDGFVSGSTYKVSASGTATSLTSTTLADTGANWTVDVLKGLYLNSQYEIASNTATTITVKYTDLTKVMPVGNSYVIEGDYVKDGLSVTFKTDKGTFLNGTQVSDPVTTSNGWATVTLRSSTTDGDIPIITAILGRLEQKAKPVKFTNVPNSILTAESGNRYVKLSWTASTSPNTTGYNIYRSTVSGSGYVKLNDAPVTTTTYKSGDLTNDKKYYYVITEVDANGNSSSYSSEVSAVPTFDLTWTKSTSNPALDVGIPGDWDDMNVGKATVILDGTTYKMWYVGSSYSDPAGKVGYATSTDGVTWTKSGSTPVLSPGLSGAWDDVEVSDCNVIQVASNDYRMWYTATGDWTVYKIGYATSTNGTTWTKDASNPVLSPTSGVWAWDNFRVDKPSVIKDGATSYRMWYRGYDGSTYKIGYATSSDGAVWAKSASNPVLSATSGGWDSSYVSAPLVVKDTTDNVFKMWYFGTDGTTPGFGYAVSADGITWNKHVTSPVLTLGATGAFDDSVISAPAVWTDNTTFKMWYTGGDGYNQRIGYASAVQDSQPPTISTFSPGSGTTGIAKDADITITFSEEMDESTMNASNITISGSTSGKVGGAVTYGGTTKIVTFNPDADFQSQEVVTVRVKGYIKDLAGNTLDGDGDGTAEGAPTDDKTWTFTVKDTLAPSAPTGLTATAGDGQVALSWTTPTTNSDGSAMTDLQGYNVYRSTTSGTLGTKITTSVLTSTSYTDTGVTNGTTYYYIVKAVDTSTNESAASSEANATPTTNPAPAAPTGVTAVAGNAQVALSWTANTETNLAGYNVWRSIVSGSGYAKVNSTLLTTATYTNTALTNGTTYYYVITAVNTSSFESSYSSQVSAVPYAPNPQAGDVDGDNKVAGPDLTALGLAFGSRSGDSNWNQYADFDTSGRIDGGDLAILGRYFGKGVTW